MRSHTTPDLKRACALAFALALALSACGATQHAGAYSFAAQRTTSTDRASQPAHSISVRVQSSDPKPHPKPHAHFRACQSRSLKLVLRPEVGGGGTAYYLIHLRNAGRTTCSLFGYPGVSFLNGDRHQLGQPAVRDQGLPGSRIKVGRFSLKPGAMGTAILTVSEYACPGGAQGSPMGGAPESTFVRVFPPGQRVAFIARQRVLVCAPQIQPIRPGKSGK